MRALFRKLMWFVAEVPCISSDLKWGSLMLPLLSRCLGKDDFGSLRDCKAFA